MLFIVFRVSITWYTWTPARGWGKSRPSPPPPIVLLYRRVSRGGPRGLAPPLEIEKQKKRASEQILSYFTYILLLFLVEIVIFSASFWAGPPLLKNWKAKKKKAFRLWAPSPTNSWTRACYIGSLFATFLHMGAFLLRFLIMEGLFTMWGPFCYYSLHGGSLFWACPPPPTKISWGTHAGILVFDYRLWILSNINDTFIIFNVIGI